jgi:hypothetical protein
LGGENAEYSAEERLQEGRGDLRKGAKKGQQTRGEQ